MADQSFLTEDEAKAYAKEQGISESEITQVGVVFNVSVKDESTDKTKTDEPKTTDVTVKR